VAAVSISSYEHSSLHSFLSPSHVVHIFSSLIADDERCDVWAIGECAKSESEKVLVAVFMFVTK
jgi:hypothetical protein